MLSMNISKFILLLVLLLDPRLVDVGHAHPHHHPINCPPTTSPYPTETAAPSPSPSESPTDTQSPSVTFLPSDSPSTYPSMIPSDSPSHSPTDAPTDSPAPSPSPSESPTLHPSYSPSISLQPSATPTKAPTGTPSSSPSSYPTITASPTGIVFLLANNVEVEFPKVSGKMNDEQRLVFEEETKRHLQGIIDQAPGVLQIEIEAITVTGQDLVDANVTEGDGNNERNLQYTEPSVRRRMNTHTSKNLLITMQVVATAILDRTENFDLKEYLEIFFENEKNTRELQMILEQESEFNGFFLEPISDGSKEAVLLQHRL